MEAMYEWASSSAVPFWTVPFWTTPAERARYDEIMSINKNDMDEREARIDAISASFRTAQQRELVRQGIALWNLTEMAQRTVDLLAEPSQTKLN